MFGRSHEPPFLWKACLNLAWPGFCFVNYFVFLLPGQTDEIAKDQNPRKGELASLHHRPLFVTRPPSSTSSAVKTRRRWTRPYHLLHHHPCHMTGPRSRARLEASHSRTICRFLGNATIWFQTRCLHFHPPLQVSNWSSTEPFIGVKASVFRLQSCRLKSCSSHSFPRNVGQHHRPDSACLKIRSRRCSIIHHVISFGGKVRYSCDYKCVNSFNICQSLVKHRVFQPIRSVYRCTPLRMNRVLCLD